MHDDIIQTLRAHAHEIYADHIEPTSLEDSNIRGQIFRNDQTVKPWFRLIE